jgi:hypothetical protein
MNHRFDLRSAKPGEPWSEWEPEDPPPSLREFLEQHLQPEATLTYTYPDGFRDEWRHPVSAEETPHP